jgi:CRISPR-associated protein Cas2
MLVLVSYDVSTTSPAGRRRLAKVAKTCSGFGMRVQFSVFECEVDPAQWEELRTRLVDLIDPDEDSVRFYYLGASWERRIEHHGLEKSPHIRGLLTL